MLTYHQLHHAHAEKLRAITYRGISNPLLPLTIPNMILLVQQAWSAIRRWTPIKLGCRTMNFLLLLICITPVAQIYQIRGSESTAVPMRIFTRYEGVAFVIYQDLECWFRSHLHRVAKSQRFTILISVLADNSNARLATILQFLEV